MTTILKSLLEKFKAKSFKFIFRVKVIRNYCNHYYSLFYLIMQIAA
uniref:Uncharacterized protein n=1 Tax=Brugia timori TaxID=42155 RepID=A0A0R3R9L5_9BILA